MKLIIEVEGGQVQRISATDDCDVIVIDHDLVDHGEEPVMAPRKPDSVMDNLRFDYISNAEIFRELKRHKF